METRNPPAADTDAAADEPAGHRTSGARRRRPDRRRATHPRGPGPRRVARRARARRAPGRRRARHPDRPGWPSRTRPRRSTSTSSEREFENASPRRTAVNEQAAAGGRGRAPGRLRRWRRPLPRTLEKFLGDRGELQQFVDESSTRRGGTRDRPIGGSARPVLRRRHGRRSPRCWTRRGSGSPLHQFRQEIAEGFKGVHERLHVASRRPSRARADERSRSAAKGGDFEDLLEDLLGAFARGAGDLVDRTATRPARGSAPRRATSS